MNNFNQVSYYTLNKSLKFILHCNNNKHQLINDLPCLDKPSFVFSLLKPRRKYKKWFIIILPVNFSVITDWLLWYWSLSICIAVVFADTQRLLILSQYRLCFHIILCIILLRLPGRLDLMCCFFSSSSSFFFKILLL